MRHRRLWLSHPKPPDLRQSGTDAFAAFCVNYQRGLKDIPDACATPWPVLRAEVIIGGQRFAAVHRAVPEEVVVWRNRFHGAACALQTGLADRLALYRFRGRSPQARAAIVDDRVSPAPFGAG